MNTESDPQPRADLLIHDAATLITCTPQPGDLLGRLENASVAIAGEHILAVGPRHAIEATIDTRGARLLDARGKIVAPGFVDSHTHLVFGGTRVQEYCARLTHSPEQVRALGIPTGILATVAMTRAASPEELFTSASQRLESMLLHGTTTVESKSGYGLDTANELKMLAVNRQLAASQPVDIVSTFLGAHAIPDDIPRERYVDQVIEEMIPAVVEERLAEFCDVYCDEGYFTVTDSRRILEAARQAGLRLKIHTDQYANLGGGELAAELGVASADHLNYTQPATVERLAQAGMVGVVMPLIDFAVDHPRPVNARAMLAAGLTLALATDLCPGCWAVSLQLALQHGCRMYHISAEQAFYAATVGGARALARDDRGALAAGMLADLQIWDLPSFEDLAYRLGHNAVVTVVKRGQVVVEDRRLVR